jgi:hypothetical protein
VVDVTACASRCAAAQVADHRGDLVEAEVRRAAQVVGALDAQPLDEIREGSARRARQRRSSIRRVVPIAAAASAIVK